ncbi:hypothetical protein ACMFMF_010184 [Clarireedia jacksonii]
MKENVTSDRSARGLWFGSLVWNPGILESWNPNPGISGWLKASRFDSEMSPQFVLLFLMDEGSNGKQANGSNAHTNAHTRDKCRLSIPGRH